MKQGRGLNTGTWKKIPINEWNQSSMHAPPDLTALNQGFTGIPVDTNAMISLRLPLLSQ